MDPIFLLACVPLLLWVSANFLDKILISKYFEEGGTAVLMIYSGLIGIIGAPIFLFFDLSALDVSLGTASALAGAGLLYGFAVWLYLSALSREDTSTVLPFFQLIPIFGLALGYFILNEVLTGHQLFWGAMVILGGLLLSIDLNGESRFGFKWKLLILVLFSSLLFALHEAFFKYLALEQGFWVSSFWQSIGLTVLGIGLLLVPKWRKEFFVHVRHSGVQIFGLNILNEIVNGVGTAIYTYLLLLAPIALVMLTHVYQAPVVFIFGLLLSIFVPNLIDEDRRPHILIQKTIAIGIITLSSYFLFIT